MMFMFIILCLVLMWLYGTRNFNYWSKRGIKHDKPLPFFGTNLKQFMQRASMGMVTTEMYNKYPEEKVVGFYRGSAPELIIRDPKIMKRILITDFQHFYARGWNPHKKVIEPLLKNLFFADGDLWRLIRKRFSPAFSTGKIKAMFHIITQRAEKLQILTEELTRLEYYDVRELMARYTTDFIGVCGFGIEMEALNDDTSQFRKLGKRIFRRTPKDALKGALKLMFPELFKNLHFLAPEIEESMVYLVKNIMKERNYKPAGKHDFIDLFLELKQQGKIVTESLESKNDDGSPKTVEIEITDMIIIAQIFVFFGAGFETSSTASSYTLHQLALNPDCQLKLQKEVDIVLAKYGGRITYEAINEMKYLECVFYEGLRMYPPVSYLVRMCTTPNYTIPEINLTINEDVKVYMPIQAFNRDAKYFSDPDKFYPERFIRGYEDKSDVYLPFGDGPRACVGARLGQLVSMIGIAAIMHKYSVEPAACTKVIPDSDPTGIVSEGFIGGLPLRFRKRIS